MDDGGLIAGLLFDGRGNAQDVGWDAIKAWRTDQGLLWVHLDRNEERACDWVRNESGLDAITAEALLAEETRPRTVPVGKGQIVILRGVNLNPGADPEDLVSLRLYADQDRIITLRYRKLMAVSDVLDSLRTGRGPRTSGDLLAMIADRLVARMEPVIDLLGEDTDALETQLGSWSPRQIRRELHELHNTAIVLKRYLTPQRDVLMRLHSDQHEWLSAPNRLRLREVGDRVTRHVEELEEVRERAVILQDELQSHLSETANRTIYILTIVAAVMLPLSFVTGLLGINVGGIPGTDDQSAFWAVCLVLLVFGVAEVWVFRRLKWI